METEVATNMDNFWGTQQHSWRPLDTLLAPRGPATSICPADAVRTVEKVLETYIALNFEEVTGAAPVSVVGSRALCSEADVVAVDELGRVHMFEVKKDEIRKRDVEQATHYMLRSVFVDRFAAFNNNPEGLEARTYALAAALAGLVCETDESKNGHTLHIGEVKHDPSLREFAIASLGRTPVKSKWSTDRQTPEGALVHIATLLAHARRHRRWPGDEALGDGVQRLLAEGRVHAATSAFGAPLPQSVRDRLPKPSRPLVLWLAAPSVDHGALEEIARLRASGVDVRAAEVDVRRDAESGGAGGRGWHVSVRREFAPERDRSEAEAVGAVRRGIGAGAALYSNFYVEKSPSERSMRADHGRHVDFPEIRLSRPGHRDYVCSSLEDDRWAATALLLNVSAKVLETTIEAWAHRAESHDWTAALGDSDWLRSRARCHWRAANRGEGKIGVDLLNRWRPGLFAGVLFHGRDHYLPAVDRNKGIDVAVFLDLQLDFLPKTPRDRRAALSLGGKFAAFANLTSAIKADPGVVAAGWQVHSATDQLSPNYWHPLAVRRSLVDVLGGRWDPEAGYAQWISALEEGLRVITRQPALTDFAHELERKATQVAIH